MIQTHPSVLATPGGLNAGPKEHKPENCPHKAWKDRMAADGAVENPGSPEGDNIFQGTVVQVGWPIIAIELSTDD